ncbi:amino acid ABC transporter permease [Streptomyces sp. NPDC018029]|uniref:amino acid ABC transporter permease n=1 Tax=Streptomyces sp. NPDC018029 TaxID=3365032 RepID=UPI0037B4A219
MDVLTDNADLFWQGFMGTVRLMCLSTLLALALGILLVSLRISPVPLCRGLGATVVTVLCNTPLTVLFFGVTLGLPMLGLTGASYFTLAVLVMGSYASAFVCEALRSGVNTVETGQAEAARSLGMSTMQAAVLVVFPQAGRAAVPPLGNVVITLVKNSALAGGFSVYELFSTEKTLVERGYAVAAVFLWVTVAYLLLISVISTGFRLLERRLAVPR